MNPDNYLYLLSMGPFSGVDTIYLESAHLSGILRKIKLKTRLVEISPDENGLKKFFSLLEKEHSDCTVILEGRFEYFKAVRSVVTTLEKDFPHVAVITWGPMTRKEFEISPCGFLTKTIKFASGISCVVGEILKRYPDEIFGVNKTEKLPLLPFSKPDYPGMPMAKYIEKYETTGRHWNLLSSRGCFSGCAFCSRAGGKVVFRDLSCLAEEIKFLMEKHGMRRFAFTDDNFLLSHNRVLKLLAMIRELGGDISFRFQGRVDRLNKSLIPEMKSAGLAGISMGIESGDQGVLDSLNKNLKVAEIRNCLDLLSKYEIPYHATFLLGSPAESDSSIENTSRLIKSHFRNNYRICFLKPLPGTPVYKDAVQKFKIIDETAYCEKLGPGYESLAVNLTNHSDSTLLSWKSHLNGLKLQSNRKEPI